MISSFKEKIKTKLQIDQSNYIHFALPPTSRIDRSHFSLASNTVDHCFANTVFKPSLLRYSTRSQMTLDIRLRKTNTRQKR